MSLKLSVGCNCCSPVPCCVCNPVFPSSLYTGEYDVTFSGFFNSFECGYCDFLENTFTLECLGGLSGTCFDVPTYDAGSISCNWGIYFTGDIADRSCVIEEASTILLGWTLKRSITWTSLILRRFEIDNGVDDPYPHWRLQMGYVMFVQIYQIVYTPDGDPVVRGISDEQCNEFHYDFPQSSSAFPATCILDSGDTWTKTEPAPLSVTYPPFGFPQETLTVQLSDFCDTVSSASVEAVLV